VHAASAEVQEAYGRPYMEASLNMAAVVQRVAIDPQTTVDAMM
jgi:hypothetical protein